VLLEVRGIRKAFGGLQAVSDFSFEVEEGELIGLIGPNGAGKTTIFNLITGVAQPDHGTVRFAGVDITGRKPHVVAGLGIGRTFQQAALFPDFTTRANIVASSNLHPKSSFWHTFFNTRHYRDSEETIRSDTTRLLHLTGLESAENELARNLSYGYQKMLGIARALVTKPRLLMLDEPLSGLNSDEVSFTLDIIRRLRDSGVTIMIIEHNMRILTVCSHVVVINFGTKIADGSVDEVRRNQEVVTAYLGADIVA
jgi:branched-chain amino acid transport system ATP-binding protein